ncbi:MAG TPA: hypothetical protein VFS40_06285 [Gemmatimonadales bacterium]|nr:hypothetical protein [Gemmatimonadales bacterium]
MRQRLLAGVCLALALGAAGCQDQPTAPAANASAATASAAALRSAGPNAALSRALPGGASLERGEVVLPPAARITDQQLTEAVRRALNPNDYVCPPSTPISDWWLQQALAFRDQEPALFQTLYVDWLADLIPTYEALYFETTATPQYFGYHGEYNRIMAKTEKDVKRFWDIRSDDIQLVAMHGTVLQDVERTAATYEAVFGLPAPLARQAAEIVRAAVLQSQVLDGGNHPLFSFNAFAFSTFGGPIPDKIVMGDGILAGYSALGFDDVAPQAIYAHEFAHHIQFENGYFDDPYATTGSAAEQTRYTELMSDAMSAYYLTHARGAAMNQKRVEQFLEVFYEIGDCAFSDPGHHGTPNQRMAAARFGFQLAAEAQKQGHILPSAEVHARFVAAYPGLVAPDAI